MLALSVALFVAFTDAFQNLERSCERTYDRLRFMHLALFLDGAPSWALERIARFPEVAGLESRHTAACRVLLGSSPGRHVRCRLIGLPSPSRPQVNDVHLEDGRYLSLARGEALVERRFASRHGYEVGSRIELECAQRRRRLRVVGLVSSPEYIWLAQDRYDPTPSPRNLAVVFTSQGEVDSLSDRSWSHEVQLRLAPGSDPADVQARCDRLLHAFYASPPMPRERQPSNSLLVRDRRAFATIAVLFPLLFLALSTLLLFASLWQMATRQRWELGVLMAQGFSHRTLFLRYVWMSLALGAAGSLVGLGAGQTLGALCTHAYVRTLAIPHAVNQPHWGSTLLGVAAALAASLGAGAWATSRILQLEPWQALRANFSDPGRISRAGRRLPFLLRLPLRNLVRQPVRTLAAGMGMAFSTSLVLMTLALVDSQESTLRFFFTRVHTYNLQVNLARPTSGVAAPPLDRWEGVQAVERVLRLGAEFSHAQRQIEVSVWGLPPDGDLLALYTRDGTRVFLEPEGPVLTGPVHLRNLGARPGETVRLALRIGRQEPPQWPQTLGPELYEPVANPPKLPLRRLQLQAEATRDFPHDAVNIMLLRVAPHRLESLKNRLYEDPRVADLIDLEDTRASIRDLLRMLSIYRQVMVGCACLVGLAMVAGTTALNLQERRRELAVMGALGVGDATLARLILTEALMVAALGLAAGIPAGIALGGWLVNSYQSDFIQMRLAVQISTILGTAAANLGIAVAGVAAVLPGVLTTPLASVVQSRNED
ncbi:MAG: ABC transporter permease [Candidatus Eremiobacterota bacterium]